MEQSIVTALSAVMGSLVGGASSICTAWFTHRAHSRLEMLNSDFRRREQIYTEFIVECSKLSVDALSHSLDSPTTLMQVYALQNRIRLTSSREVVLTTETTIKKIISQSFKPKITIEQLRAEFEFEQIDLLREFSEACRKELKNLQYPL
ncbi:hypothetical protein [Tolumonas lignilytica]|uniref:hypothetical protein n=1 Tax=Tolumonas lignilytica TaxID=1283284 RepID=UPI000463BBFA|nr:hypothetical protein [Tolumonas lignilytica]